MYYQPYYSQPQQHQPPPQHQPQQHQPQQHQPQQHQPSPQHQPQQQQPQQHQPQPHQSPPHQPQPHQSPPHQPPPHHPPHIHQQPQPPLHSSREPHHTYRPAYSSFYRPAPAQNRSSHNLKFSREFERFPTPPHGYSSMPSGAYPFYDATNQQHHQQQQQQQQRWRPSTTRVQNQYRRTPAFHFQDKSTYYYMSDPIITNDNRITIQLTKVHVGHNGDQQRVFVEQEFSDESELKKFVKNLRHNFEKTFNNRATGAHSSSENIDQNQSPNSKKSGVIVVEEPDEEPKIYEQQAYNENIESKQSRNNKSSIASSPRFDDCEHCQRSPVDSSCSTARTKGRRRHKTKHHREKFDTELHIEEKEQPTEKIPSYSHQYEPPPRFQQQQRTFPREKDFRMRNDFSVPPNLNSHWRYNGYSHSLNSRSRSYIPAMNENHPPSTPSRFQYTKEPLFRPIHPPTPSRFTHSKNQHKSQPSPRFYHTSHPRRNQPRTIADHFTFMNNEHQQTRVHRTRSECRPQVPIRSRSKTYLYLEYGNNLNQRHYTPYAQSSAPMFYTQRRFFRNPQKHSCLFNSYRPNSKRF